MIIRMKFRVLGFQSVPQPAITPPYLPECQRTSVTPNRAVKQTDPRTRTVVGQVLQAVTASGVFGCGVVSPLFDPAAPPIAALHSRRDAPGTWGAAQARMSRAATPEIGPRSKATQWSPPCAERGRCCRAGPPSGLEANTGWRSPSD